MSYTRPHLLIYDGDCGLCQLAVSRAAWIDKEALFTPQPWQSLTTADFAYLGLTPEDCAQAVQVVKSDGQIFSGAAAINHILCQRRGGRMIVSLIEKIPLLSALEVYLYRLVARNRRAISALLGLRTCPIVNLADHSGTPPSTHSME